MPNSFCDCAMCSWEVKKETLFKFNLKAHRKPIGLHWKVAIQMIQQSNWRENGTHHSIKVSLCMPICQNESSTLD